MQSKQLITQSVVQALDGVTDRMRGEMAAMMMVARCKAKKIGQDSRDQDEAIASCASAAVDQKEFDASVRHALCVNACDGFLNDQLALIIVDGGVYDWMARATQAQVRLSNQMDILMENAGWPKVPEMSI